MDDLESRLREFRPRRPAMIPDRRLQLLRGPIWLGVVALIAAAMLIASWIRQPQKPSAEPAAIAAPTLGALNQYALRPDDLDRVLAQLSGTLLPDVGAPGTALQDLAKQ